MFCPFWWACRSRNWSMEGCYAETELTGEKDQVYLFEKTASERKWGISSVYKGKNWVEIVIYGFVGLWLMAGP